MNAPRGKPIPQPTPETKPYWDAARRHELTIQRCTACGKHYFYPRPYCPHCLSDKTEWTKVSGKGTLHTYVINHRPAPGFENEAPYVIAIVKLDEGPHMMTNIVETEQTPAALQLDMPLEVVFQKMNDEISLPLFRPAGRRA